MQSELNNAPLQRLDDNCPLTVLTGLYQDNPLLLINRMDVGTAKWPTIEEIRAVMSLKRLNSSIDIIHNEISDKSSGKRKSAVDSHSRNTGVKDVNFDVDDLVLHGVL